MTAYHISYYLYRSNPIIMREIKLPADCTVGDTIAALCLGMGIPAASGEVYDEENRQLTEKKRLSEIFGIGTEFRQTTGRMVIYQDKKTREIAALTFFFEAAAETEEELTSPEILQGIGYHLPQKVFRISQINEILEGIRSRESYVLSGTGTFYEGQQAFHIRKTQNLLYSYFAPHLASSLKSEIGVPMQTVLENRNMSELRALADMHHIYPYVRRKSNYIEALSIEMSEVEIKWLFRDMDILEYLNFRNLVLTGKTCCKTNDMLPEEFPVLDYFGMISISKKQDVFLAAPVLQDYEEWFDREEEKQLRIGKRIAFVLNGCGLYYGIFSKKLCQAILDTLYPGEVSEEKLEQFWKSPFKYSGELNVILQSSHDTQQMLAYENKLFNEKELPVYMAVLSGDDSPRYIPDRESFEKTVRKGILKENNNDFGISRFLRGYIYYDSEREEYCRLCINCFRKGYPVSEVTKKMMSHIRVWYDRESVQVKLESILTQMSDKVPAVLYYGYSVADAKEKGIQSLAGIELNRRIRELEAEEARKKQEAERKKKEAAVKRRAAAKGIGTTGKRGTKK